MGPSDREVPHTRRGKRALRTQIDPCPHAGSQGARRADSHQRRSHAHHSGLLAVGRRSLLWTSRGGTCCLESRLQAHDSARRSSRVVGATSRARWQCEVRQSQSRGSREERQVGGGQDPRVHPGSGMEDGLCEGDAVDSGRTSRVGVSPLAHSIRTASAAVSDPCVRGRWQGRRARLNLVGSGRSRQDSRTGSRYQLVVWNAALGAALLRYAQALPCGSLRRLDGSFLLPLRCGDYVEERCGGEDHQYE